MRRLTLVPAAQVTPADCATSAVGPETVPPARHEGVTTGPPDPGRGPGCHGSGSTRFRSAVHLVRVASA